MPRGSGEGPYSSLDSLSFLKPSHLIPRKKNVGKWKSQGHALAFKRVGAHTDMGVEFGRVWVQLNVSLEVYYCPYASPYLLAEGNHFRCWPL